MIERALCHICKLPVDGRYKRGNKYYCASDFEKQDEKIENDKRKREIKEYKKLFR